MADVASANSKARILSKLLQLLNFCPLSQIVDTSTNSQLREA
jgi:hypothetical protein